MKPSWLAVVVLMATSGCGKGDTSELRMITDPLLAPVVTAPAGWKAMPSLASVVAAEDSPTVAATAWGDPAAGCYALWFTMRTTGPSTIDIERGGLGTMLSSFGVNAAPSGSGATPVPQNPSELVDIVLDGKPGKLQLALTQLASRQVVLDAVACFHNEREPIACTIACGGILDGAIKKRPGQGAT